MEMKRVLGNRREAHAEVVAAKAQASRHLTETQLSPTKGRKRPKRSSAAKRISEPNVAS